MTPRAILAILIGLGLAMIAFLVMTMALLAARGRGESTNFENIFLRSRRSIVRCF